MSAPSNRTGFRPDAPTTAQRPRFRDKQTGIRDRKRTSTIINVDEVETYDGVADQCFIVARLIHDDVLEPQDFGRTIFVNTGDSGGGWHDISPSKRLLLGSWWRMVAAGVICPKAEDRPRQRLK